jgi:DNA-binding Lrp family transcriptional regulator
MKRALSSSVSARVSRLDIEQMRLITRASRLHHMKGKRQAEIAEEMGISQASVSRLLSLAQEYGIVRTVVVSPEGLYPDLEDSLVDAYGLKNAFVIDINSREEGVAHVLGTAAARCLAGELKGGPVIGSPPGARHCGRWREQSNRAATPRPRPSSRCWVTSAPPCCNMKRRWRHSRWRRRWMPNPCFCAHPG